MLRRWTEWAYILWMVLTLPSMPLVHPAAFTTAVCHVILKIRLPRSVRGPVLSFVCFMNRYMHWDCITVLMLWSCENMFLTHFTVMVFIQTGSHNISAPVMLWCNEIIPQDWIKENIQVQMLYKFFVKCTVLPPGGLFHPGLPYR